MGWYKFLIIIAPNRFQHLDRDWELSNEGLGYSEGPLPLMRTNQTPFITCIEPIEMMVPIDGGTPQNWMVYKGKSHG